MSKQGSIANIVKNIYYDEFRWSLVKSIGFFALGIAIAKECIGMEFVPATN